MSNYVCPHCGAHDSTRCEMRGMVGDREPSEAELERARAVGCRVAYYVDRRAAGKDS